MRLFLLGLLLAVVVVSSGCIPVLVAAGAGAAAVVRENTDEAVTYKGNINSVENGVSKAMLELGATLFEKVVEPGRGGYRTFRAETYDGEALTIDMEPTSPNSVMVEVRVGRIGNKQRAAEFHRAIQKYLRPTE